MIIIINFWVPKRQGIFWVAGGPLGSQDFEISVRWIHLVQAKVKWLAGSLNMVSNFWVP
jgi:hypothetical protein